MTAEPFDLPDGHRTVELRALMSQPGTRTHASHDGVILANNELEFGGVYGSVPEATLRAFLDRSEFVGQLLFVAELAPSMEGFEFQRALVFGRVTEPPPPRLRPLPAGLDLRLATVGDDFSLFDDDTMAELYDAARRGAVHVVAHESRVVVAAYPAWQSEGFADVSVDTVEAFRGRGLGGHAVLATVRAIEATGRRPVWGALETNVPSLRLARRLGFLDERGAVYLARYPGP